MPLHILTVVHVIISLLAIASGFIVMAAMARGEARHPWTGFFLAMTVATSATGFLFPIKGFTPALAFGVLSLILLAVAIHALYSRRLEGGWRRVYLVNAIFAHYLNAFVLVVQMFQKIPALRSLAPTQSEPPFGAAQGLLLIGFLWAGSVAVRKNRVIA